MIQVQNLVTKYGDFTAVDDVSFTAEAGRVTGFLGPNGAGKSTTMRVMTGLTPATAGTATVLGTPYANLTNPGRHVGVLLDASAQHAGRTGREILTLGAMTLGIDNRRAARSQHPRQPFPRRLALVRRQQPIQLGLPRADPRPRLGRALPHAPATHRPG